VILFALTACAAPQAVGVSGAVSEFRFEEDDLILPVRITHNSEQIWNGSALEHNYNYLVYEFETEQHLYRARAYLDDIRTVAIYGPFDKGSENAAPLEGLEIDERVLTYLRRRYAEIMVLGPNGYVPIE
jgi:hypothetical protein